MSGAETLDFVLQNKVTVSGAFFGILSLIALTMRYRKK